MTEPEYKRTFGNTDDAAKFYREPEQIRCLSCRELFEEQQLKNGLCDFCDRQVIIDNEN